jgi:hypothetical protein
MKCQQDLPALLDQWHDGRYSTANWVQVLLTRLGINIASNVHKLADYHNVLDVEGDKTQERH